VSCEDCKLFGPTWHKRAQKSTKEHKAAHFGTKWPKLAQVGTFWHKTAQKSTKRHKVAHFGTKRHKRAQKSTKRHILAQSGTKWPKPAQSGPKCYTFVNEVHPEAMRKSVKKRCGVGCSVRMLVLRLGVMTCQRICLGHFCSFLGDFPPKSRRKVPLLGWKLRNFRPH
jgi:hypothetical protein